MTADDDLAQLGARVETGGSTGASTSREILDAGRPGLEFFRAFGPAYAIVTGTDFDFERDFARPYEGHDEFAFGVLRADQERFTAIGEGLEDTAVNLRNRGEAVFDAWQGGAADAAQTRFGHLLTTADKLRGRFAKLSEALAETIETADRACYTKATGVARLHATAIDGRTPEDVTFLATAAPGLRSGDADNDTFARAVRLSKVMVPPALRRTPDGRAIVASAVDGWLTTSFAHEYQRRASRFASICATADRELEQAMHTLNAALTEVDDPRSQPAKAKAPQAQPAAHAQPTESAATAPSSANAQKPTGEHGDAGGDQDTAGSVQQTTQPDTPDHTTEAVMTPESYSGPMPGAPTGPVAGQATGAGGGTGFVGGYFPAGGAGARGGGDVERRPLNLTTGPSAFDDIYAPPTDVPSAIGADDDPANYNEEATERAEAEEEKRDQPKDDPFDDVW